MSNTRFELGKPFNGYVIIEPTMRNSITKVGDHEIINHDIQGYENIGLVVAGNKLDFEGKIVTVRKGTYVRFRRCENEIKIGDKTYCFVSKYDLLSRFKLKNNEE